MNFVERYLCIYTLGQAKDQVDATMQEEVTLYHMNAYNSIVLLYTISGKKVVVFGGEA